VSAPAPGRARTAQLALLARAVLSCEGVHRLYSGPTGRISSATHAGRVVGLLFNGSVLTVGVITAPGARADDVTENVREAVRPMVPEATRVTVVVSSSRLRTAGF
jgi:hypothetical protein